MARKLEGKTIALTGPRKASDMVKLVENMGGTARIHPAQGTVFLDDAQLRESIQSWISEPPEWVILTTGMGLDAICTMAEDMGMLDAFLSVLEQSTIAARGYKTINALKKRGLSPLVRDDDGSTEGLIRGMMDYSFEDQSVVLQLHGDPAPKLTAWLDEQGAKVRQVLPYKHVEPEKEQLALLLTGILGGQVDAVAFTSAPQVRNLIEYAREQDQLQALADAFEGPVVAAVVGRITGQALVEEGITRFVMPPVDERMGSMMVELGRYYANEVIRS
ncbi:uroporphyrinogen-III synthase [Paenibacillus pini]|uniref:Uroporphyrinogen-III synthetase n=1 Tax=Paenibacillus pini JCM 16418 TaxID=1236976 RepID=W7Z752_9BACL|nr:uroporphyrinogen-III synthase [Paenibacillus pini]GAF10129.1 uroporphyrinogen-III synthetase [Paenibacillus pini JCM 16418]